MTNTKATREPVKLVALDLDGTILNRDLQISERVQSAVRATIQKGVHVTIATGRMFKASSPYARILGLKTPIVCYQGAMIGDSETGEILFHQPVPVHLARDVIQLCQERGLHVNAYLDDELYVEQLSDEALFYAALSRVEAHVVGNLLEFLDRDTTKLVIVSDPETTTSLAKELAAKYAGVLYIARSYPIFTEVAHPDCSKSRGLDRLVEILGITPAECMAIGDNLNDIDMIRWAGTGVAIAGSSPEVLDAADHITASMDEDGAALAIERFVLEG
jgi:Cof subfamily protein (haloacid dehalogenase superfamily)